MRGEGCKSEDTKSGGSKGGQVYIHVFSLHM